MDSGEREEDDHDHTKLLVTKIRDCYDNPAFSDIKLKSKNRVFHGHKIVLNTRAGGWGVQDLSKHHLLDLSGHEDSVVERILKWTYHGISLVTISDSHEFKLKMLEALTKLSLTEAESLCKKLITSRCEIRHQIHQETSKRGMIKACGTCSGCLAPDCGICRFCQDKKKFGGEGKLKQKCKFKTCSAQIQSKNLRKINKASRDSVRERNKKSETAMTILQANKSAKSVESDQNKIDEEAGLEEHGGEATRITPLTHGAQVIQVQAGTGPTLTDAGYLPDPINMKSDPKDLSCSVTSGTRGEAEAGDMRRSNDLEAGTQASERPRCITCSGASRSLTRPSSTRSCPAT